MKRIIVTLTLAAICLISCKKNGEDYYVFNGAEMGTIENSVFTTDRGVKMNIVNYPEGSDISSKRRVMLYFVLTTNGQNTSYDIDILNIYDTVILEPEVSENAEDSPQMDAMNIGQSWFSGGYLNLYTLCYTDSEKETEQKFYAYYTIKESLASIALRRDGNGEGYFSVEKPEETYTFICIPMKKIQDEFFKAKEESSEGDSSRRMAVNLNWIWHSIIEGELQKDVVACNVQGSYTVEEE